MKSDREKKNHLQVKKKTIITCLNILENSLIVRVSYNIIYCIWGQPNIDIDTEVAKRTFWHTDLQRVKYFVTRG